MLDRIADVLIHVRDPRDWAVATVVSASGSVPREPGATMLVHRDGTSVGSLSGGCVEAAVVDAALTAVATGRAELMHIGDDDGNGFGVALTCGGELTVLVEPFPLLAGVLPNLRATAPAGAAGSVSGHDAVALVRDLPGPGQMLTAPLLLRPGDPLPDALVAHLPDRAVGDLRAALRDGTTTVVTVVGPAADGCRELGRLLVESRRPPARLLIYGANDHAAALARLARPLGWHITVCDARPAFATTARHPDAHDVAVQVPVDHLDAEVAAGRTDHRTAVVVLGHDPRFDLDVLDHALRLRLAYVGAMGSRSTDTRRRADLLEGGLPASLLDALHSPIGLDLGARTPAEVAVSVLAELIATIRRRRAAGDEDAGARQLRHTAGPVHASRPATGADVPHTDLTPGQDPPPLEEPQPRPHPHQRRREDRFSWT